VLAAVIVADADAAGHRRALRALLYRRQLRLHWRDESRTRHGQLIAAVGALPHTGAIVIAAGMAPGRPERARRKYIERLLHELAGRPGNRARRVRAKAPPSWTPATGHWSRRCNASTRSPPRWAPGGCLRQANRCCG
jgi:hypothetical protein